MEPQHRISVQQDKGYKQVDAEIRLEELDHSNLKFILKTCVEDWTDMNNEDIAVKQLTGGVTNTLYRCRCLKHAKGKTALDRVKYVLLRVYGSGTELLIDREKELSILSALYTVGLGPKLYGSFKNGYVYGYFAGRPLGPNDLRSCKLQERIAAKLAHWHKIDLHKLFDTPTENNRTAMWVTLNNWLSLVPPSYDSEDKNKKFQQINMDLIRKEVEMLETELSKLNSPLIFSHNDLLSLNIVFHEKKDLLNFIDYEYANYNHRGFDIANHFCEWTGFELDHSKFPSKDQQLQFYQAYLKESAGAEPTDQQLHALYVEVNKFVLCSHMFWSVWALVQAHISTIQFDYLQYAIDRLNRYFAIRQDMLNLC